MLSLWAVVVSWLSGGFLPWWAAFAARLMGQARELRARAGESFRCLLEVQELELRLAPATWENIGPFPQQDPNKVSNQPGEPVSGRISALAIAGNSLFVGAASGGIWSSDNYTRAVNDPAGPPTWAPLTDAAGLNALTFVDPQTGLGAGLIDIGTIAVSPRTDNSGRATLYAGTGEAS